MLFDLLPEKRATPLSWYHRQHDMGWELPVMIDSLHGQFYFR